MGSKDAFVHHARLCDHAQHDHEHERGQVLDYSQYELLGHPVRVRRRAARVARFVASYHAIRRAEMHDDLQKDLIEEWWTWNSRQRVS